MLYICTNVSDKAISVEILSRAIVRLVFLGLSFFTFLVRVLFSEKISGPLGTKFPVCASGKEWQRIQFTGIEWSRDSSLEYSSIF